MPNTGGYHGVPIQQSKYVPYSNNPQQQAAYSQSQTEMNEAPPAGEDDNISKSSESSFISGKYI